MSPIPTSPLSPARRTAHAVAAGTFLLFVLALVGGAGGIEAAPARQLAQVPDELIVVFERNAGPNERASAVAQAKVRQKRAFPQLRAALVESERGDSAEAFRKLARHPHVRYVQPNYVYSASEIPDDPSFSQLWGLHNTGQTGGTPDADIDAPEAWDSTTGSADVTVAVIDTGVDFGHPDLAAQQWVNAEENCGSTDPTVPCAQRTDAADNDGNGLVDDWRGWDWVSDDNNPFDDQSHGTHVAGTIGAVGNNATGVAGVNWNVRIMALKFLSSAGTGTTADAVAATLYAADQGASVANNSWGGGAYDQTLLDAIEYGAARGLLYVAAAGNDGRDNDGTPTYPASYVSDAVLAVAATDHNDALASFSNYGATGVDLGAPGASIFSTTPGATYGTKSGTSMATPHVAGAAALVRARFPGATVATTKALLLRTVDPKSSLAGRTVSGGRLNVGNAAGCDDDPVAWLISPAATFGVGVGDSVAISLVGANCGAPAGVSNVAVTVNGTAVSLSALSPDTGVYTGSYTATAEGTLTVNATVTVGGQSDTDVATGTAVRNYTCQEVPWDGWVDATPYTNLGLSLDAFKTFVMPFPFTFYGQTYSTFSVSSHGFVSLGSSAGTASYANTALPNAALPNGLIAPFWDDLNPGLFGGGQAYGVWSGAPPNRQLTIEWFNVPHTFLIGAATFEVTMYESGEVRFRYLDTDFGDARFNAGASATAGVESPAGTVGKQFSFNQPVLTAGKAVSCTPPSTAPPPDPPTISTTSLDDATRTEPYSETLAATGGTPPYTWSVDSGTLPLGLALDSGTGAISGTPTAAGTSSFTVRVTDAASQSSTRPLTIDVTDPLAITTSALPNGTAGSSYSAEVAAQGGAPPYAWSVVAGALPPGLVLDAATGAITGSPTAAGTSAFDVQVVDSGDPARTDVASLSITVVAPLAIATSTLPGATVGSAYSQAVTATGGSGSYSWSIASGTAPPGLTLSSGTPSATLSGTPTTAGSFTFTVEVTDGSQSDQQQLTVTVVAALVVTTTTLPGGTVGQAYSQLVTASGGGAAYAWSVVSGSLPPGVTLSSGTPSATLAGTPTTAGSFTFTVEVTDGSQSDQQQLTVTVVAPPPPTIEVASVAYSTAGGSAGTRDLLVSIRITFGGTPVGGAAVRMNLRRNGASYGTKNATTAADGYATFRFNRYPTGCYTTVVVRVTYNGQTYTPTTPANSHCK